MTLKSKAAGIVCAVVCAAVVHLEKVEASHYDCYGVSLQFMYSGDEVSCDSASQQALCEAFCDLCFNTGCIDPLQSECREAEYDRRACANVE